GLTLVCVDSTGPQNRSMLTSQGSLDERDIAEISQALDEAPARGLVAILLHHHPIPLPHDRALERMSTWFGWDWGRELDLGRKLLETARGRCDLILHGHRHRPRALTLFEGESRPLQVFNAGSSTELATARVFAHR